MLSLNWRPALDCGCRWILTLNYAFCFGVELTLNNIITPYMADQFGLSQVSCAAGKLLHTRQACRTCAGPSQRSAAIGDFAPLTPNLSLLRRSLPALWAACSAS